MTLEPLFRPGSIAVVGASANPDKAGGQMLRSLASFEGTVVAVNPRERQILGRTCYPRLTDVPFTVELAILVLPPEATVAAIADAARAGIRAAVACSGGFAESGSEGAALQARAAAIARGAGLRLLGPNTSGFVAPADNLVASFVPAAKTLRPGEIAVVAQSGGTMHALAFQLNADGAGVRLGVGLGNAVDVGFTEMLEHLEADPGTRAIVLAVEGVADGRALYDAVARVTQAIPVVALKAGRADVGAFARSHTGALTGSWRLTRSALAQAGAVVVESTIELADAARTLAARRLPATERAGVAVVTGQAGPALIVEDTLRSHGVDVPRLAPQTRERLAALLPPLTYQANPVDTGRPPPEFGAVVEAVASDPAIDALVVYALDEPAAVDPVTALAGTAKPTLFATAGPRDAIERTIAVLAASGVPLHTSPERAALAARALVADARAAARKRAPAIVSLDARDGVPRDEDAAKTLLQTLGIRAPRRHACDSRTTATAAMKDLGSPVVVKVLASWVEHKSDAGGVFVGVRSEEDLAAAVESIVSRFGASVRFLVEEQLPDGVELIVGASRDPSFGASVLVGLGGLAAEATADVAVRVAPLSKLDALEMIAELRCQALLDGPRGLPRVDRDELARVITTIGALVATNPAIGELDVNPLRATADGLVALDALVIPSAPDGR